MARKYFIETYGCEMNKSDSIDIALSLQAEGFEEASCEDNADVIVLNTCSVRGHAEERIFGRLGYYRSLRTKRHEDLLIVLAGCMAQEQGDRIMAHFPEIKVVTGTYNHMHIPDAVQEYCRTGNPVVLTDREQYDFSPFKGSRAEGHSAWVNIIMGCSNFCSYCIVPHLRGPEKSKPSGEVIDEIRQLVERGVVEVTLLGQNVNAYGGDSGDLGFVDLLERVNDIPGIHWVRFLTSHPRDFDHDTIRRIAGLDKVCRHVHLPLQSGSDRILSLMNRQYNLNQYRSIVDAIRTHFSDVAITTDIIVGFPTETEKDFTMTLDVVREIGFDDAFTYRYSSRPFTGAAELTASTDTATAGIRLEELIELQRSISHQRNEEEIGKCVTALIERESKKNADEMLCKTEKNKMVVVPTDLRPGRFIDVEIESVSGNTLRALEVRAV
jgi:tRNA-2-methylthio-N6-dimethylallyladenosine synthase